MKCVKTTRCGADARRVRAAFRNGSDFGAGGDAGSTRAGRCVDKDNDLSRFASFNGAREGPLLDLSLRVGWDAEAGGASESSVNGSCSRPVTGGCQRRGRSCSVLLVGEVRSKRI